MSDLAASSEGGRLRQVVLFDIVTTIGATLFAFVVHVAVVRSPWLLGLCLVNAVGTGLMIVALGAIRRGDLSGAVARMAAANWMMALTVAAVAVFPWPLMILAGLLPAVIAAPYEEGPRLRRYLVLSLAVSVGVAGLGLLQDFSGLQTEVPRWAATSILFLFTPFMAGMVLVTALQHSIRLSESLGRTLAVNRELVASRARLVAASDRERRRMERDLHDGAQQRLVAIRLGLRLAEDLAASDPSALPEFLAELRESAHGAQEDLRNLARGVYPVVLTQHGLEAALAAAADVAPIEVVLACDGLGRFTPDVEAAVYFCVSEALTNAAKYAGDGASALVEVRFADEEVHFSVTDDGVGFDASAVDGHGGLEHLRDRLGAVDGSLSVESAPGRGVTVMGRVPIPADDVIGAEGGTARIIGSWASGAVSGG